MLPAAMLDVENLEKTYRGNQAALRGCSFTLADSGIVAVIGPSGAGKSSLIRCINRLVEPSGGRIRVRGVEITGLRAREMARMRRRIGMIFQEYNLVERLTVMENVLSGRLGFVSFGQALLRRFPQADIERAFDLLERVGLAGCENKRADALSGGQRQRVGVARALIQAPELLLVDEPTSSLDPRTARAILSLIADLARERDLPVLINMHDVELARAFAGRVIGLADGRVVFDGPPSALDDTAFARIYGAAPADAHGNGAGTTDGPSGSTGASPQPTLHTAETAQG